MDFLRMSLLFLLFETSLIGIESDLKSNFLDVDQLSPLASAKKGQGISIFISHPSSSQLQL